MKDAMVKAANKAIKEGSTCYLYENNNKFENSFRRYRNWLYKAEPHGPMELSARGKAKLAHKRP